MVFPMHISSLSYEGEPHKCGVHPCGAHPHVRRKIHTSETPCIFSSKAAVTGPLYLGPIAMDLRIMCFMDLLG